MAKLFCLGDVAYLISSVVPLSWMYGFARLQGRFKYVVCRKERAVVRANLRSVLGGTNSENEIEWLTQQVFEQKQLRGLLLYVFPKLTPSQLDKLLPMDGLEHLDRALSQKKGVVLLGSHLNSIMTLLTKDCLRTRGYDVRVALPTKILPYSPTLFHQTLDKLSPKRNRVKQDGAFFAQFNIRPIVRSLGQNATVLLMGDGWHSAGFVQMKFLDRQVYFTTGAVSIARMTGSPVIPFFVTGSAPDRLKVVFEEPIPLERSNDLSRDLETMVADYVQRLEHRVRKNIACWQHLFNDHALDTMAALLEKPLGQRHQI